MGKYDAVKESRKEIFFNNIIGGIGWGLGATVGAAIILAIAGMVVARINTVPIIGGYVENIMEYIAEKQPQTKNYIESDRDRVDKKE